MEKSKATAVATEDEIRDNAEHLRGIQAFVGSTMKAVREKQDQVAESARARSYFFS